MMMDGKKNGRREGKTDRLMDRQKEGGRNEG